MNIFIVGATGRMGEEIQKLIAENKKLKFVKVAKNIDMVIDFSNAEIFSTTVEWCVDNKLPLVSGTTGITTTDKKLIAAAGKKIPILWAPNTAPGVHWVKRIFSQLGIPPNFDVQVTETHHTRKKDKPSGTALLLQDAIVAKKKNVPPPLSIRGGGVFGIHRIDLMSEDETITIEHQALSRTVFARGALDAALWLQKKKPGVYTMDDVIADLK